MTSQVFSQCPVLLDSSSQCAHAIRLNLVLRHSTTSQIPHSLVVTAHPTQRPACPILSLVWVLPLSPVLTPLSLTQLVPHPPSIYRVGQGMRTDDAEALDGTGNNAFNEMDFRSRKLLSPPSQDPLKAEYSLELAQDLKAIHGLNAEAELANILSTEILNLRSTVKSSEPSTRLLSKVLYRTPLPLAYSTSTSTPTADGLLRSSKDFYSRSSVMLTQSHKELVEERATSSCALLTLRLH